MLDAFVPLRNPCPNGPELSLTLCRHWPAVVGPIDQDRDSVLLTAVRANSPALFQAYQVAGARWAALDEDGVWVSSALCLLCTNIYSHVNPKMAEAHHELMIHYIQLAHSQGATLDSLMRPGPKGSMIQQFLSSEPSPLHSWLKAAPMALEIWRAQEARAQAQVIESALNPCGAPKSKRHWNSL